MSNIKKPHSKEIERTAANMRVCRMCTVPVQRPYLVIRHPIVQVNVDSEALKQDLSEANKENAFDYDKPILNSLLAVTRQMEEMQLEKSKNRVTDIESLSPRSKAIILPKIMRKLNFPPDKIVFRNLTPINVNDSNLLPKRPQSLHKKYIKSNARAPAPDLADFLDPLPPLEHTIPEPNIDLIYGRTEIDTFGEFYDFYQYTNPRHIASNWGF